jgi:hypothetical protein
MLDEAEYAEISELYGKAMRSLKVPRSTMRRIHRT